MNESSDTPTAPAIPLRFHEKKLDPALLRLRQEAGDTQLRMRLGGIFYVLGWLFVVLAGGPRGTTAWLVGGLLLVLALLRFAFPVPVGDSTTVPMLRRALRWPWLMIFSSCTVWGIACAWVLADPQYDSARTVALFGCVAFATASAHAFAMRRLFAIATLGLLLVPPLWALSVVRHETALAWMMLVYSAYAGLALERSHREWMQRLKLDLELRQQRDQFARLSRRDGLTGLSNRMHFDSALRSAVEQAHRTREPLSLLLCDIDHFKSVNDRFGHSEGDACLIAFAQRLQREFASGRTLVARVGGEEFAVLLRGVPLADAHARAEKFRVATQEQCMLTTGGGTAIAITVSFGVAGAALVAATDVENLYRAADLALYRAKSAGRNQVQIATGTESPSNQERDNPVET